MKNKWFYLFLLFLIVITLFSRVRNYEFVWDDEVNITKNRILTYSTFTALKKFWSEPLFSLYIPVTYTAWLGVYKLMLSTVYEKFNHEKNARLFHLTNVLFHLLNGVIVFLLLRLLFHHDWGAFLGAAFFCLHPFQVEPVCWITGFKDVLSGFFSLTTILFYLYYAQSTRKWRWAIFSSLSFLLAMLSKPSAVSLPLIVFFLDLLLLKRRVGQAIRMTSLWVLLAIPIILITKKVQPFDLESVFIPFFLKPIVAFDALMFYFMRLIYPIGLTPDENRHLFRVLLEGSGYFSWIFLLVFIVLLIKKFPRWALASFCIIAAALLPNLGFITFGFQTYSTVANRYAYLAVFGGAIAMCSIIVSARTRWVSVFGMLFLICCFGYSYQLVGIWQNSLKLWKHAVDHNQGSFLGLNNYGSQIGYGHGRVEEAEELFKRAVFLKRSFGGGEFPTAIKNYGNMLMLRGELDKALPFFEYGANTERVDYSFLASTGAYFVKIGRVDQGFFYLNRAMELKPDDFEVRYRMGDALLEVNRPREAIPHYEKALFDPYDSPVVEEKFNDELKSKVFTSLGIASMKSHLKEKAIDAFKKAMELNRNDISYKINWVRALRDVGRTDEAKNEFEKLYHLYPNHWQLLILRELILHESLSQTQLLEHYERMLKIRPNDTRTLLRAGNIKLKMKDQCGARSYFENAKRLMPSESVETKDELSVLISKLERETT